MLGESSLVLPGLLNCLSTLGLVTFPWFCSYSAPGLRGGRGPEVLKMESAPVLSPAANSRRIFSTVIISDRNI